MSKDYPFLNSVNIKNKTCENDKDSDNKSSDGFSFNGFNEIFEDANIDLSDFRSDDISDVYSPNINKTKDFHTNNLTRNVLAESSISSLSSLTSNSDLPNSSNQIANDSCDSINRFTTLKTQQKQGLLNHLSNLMNFGKHKSGNSGSSSIKSTTCLILNDRPSGLPPKNPDEIKKHNAEYNRLINSIKKKEKQTSHENKAKEISKLYYEERQSELAHVWKTVIIPNWYHQQYGKYVRHIWWEGLPTSVRDKVWRLCIPNSLNLTEIHYDNFLSQLLERLARYSENIPSSSTSINKSSVCHSNTTQSNVVLRNTDELETNTSNHTINHNKTCPNNHLSNQNHESTRIRRADSASRHSYVISEAANLQTATLKRASTNSTCSGLTPSPGYCNNLDQNGEDKRSVLPDEEDLRRQALENTIKLDVSRTFPQLQLFQEGGPHHDPLYQLLGAYVCARPDIGYVQGMSFLAAVLLLVMASPGDAFILFANILEMPCHHAFYSLDETQFLVHIETFKALLLTHMSHVSEHFVQQKLEVHMFLCDWLFTIYSRALPLETALRVWDIFCRDGEVALYRAGLGILRMYESQLLASEFDELASFLTSPLPDSITPDALVEQMREIKLSKKEFNTQLEEVQSRVSELKKHNLSISNNISVTIPHQNSGTS